MNSNYNDILHIGCDEAGVGEFIGGCSFGFCLWETKHNELLSSMKLVDSKNTKSYHELISIINSLKKLEIKKYCFTITIDQFNLLTAKRNGIVTLNNNEFKTISYIHGILEFSRELKIDLIKTQIPIIIDGYCEKKNWEQHINRCLTREMIDVVQKWNIVLIPKADFSINSVKIASLVAKNKRIEQIFKIRNKIQKRINKKLFVPFSNNREQIEEWLGILRKHEFSDDEIKAIVKNNFLSYFKTFNLPIDSK